MSIGMIQKSYYKIMNNIKTKLKELLLAPIQKYLLLFIILIVFMNLSCTVFFIDQNIYYAVQMFFVSVLVSYITTILILYPPPMPQSIDM